MPIFEHWDFVSSSPDDLRKLATAFDLEYFEQDNLISHSMETILYTFDKDMKGMSMCNDKCAQNWPPLAAAAKAKPMGDWTIVDRQDGTKQWAYKGKPLYTFAKDMKAGDAMGNGAGNGVWHVAMP